MAIFNFHQHFRAADSSIARDVGVKNYAYKLHRVKVYLQTNNTTVLIL